jgi:hypothetical protein
MAQVNVNDVELSIAGVDVISAAQAPDEAAEFDLSKGIFRYCGAIPDDDWVKRVERLNARIDHLHKILKQETGKDGYCFIGTERPDASVSVTFPPSFVPDELKVEL